MKGNRGLFAKKGFLAVTAILMSAVLFSGCSKIAEVLEDTLGKTAGSEEVSSVEDTSEAGGTSEEKGALGETFASKLVGNYKCEISHDEVALLSIYNVGGNLYAYLGQAMTEDNGKLSPEDNIYSYYALEIMPTNAGAFLDSSATSAEAGFIAFSDMSNFSKYWGSPNLGVITLTDDGIKITAKDENRNPLYLYDAEMNFVRDSELKGHFTYDTSYVDSKKGQDIPEKLCGLWQLDGDDGYFFEFIQGKDPQICGFQIYHKMPGTEVKLGRGLVAQDKDDTYYADYTVLHSGAPSTLQFTVGFEGDDTLKLSADDFNHAAYDYIGGEITLHRAERKDTPLVTCYAIDDANAYKQDIVINAPDLTTRKIVPQLLAAQEIENNGGYFVRADKFVFFRYYANENMPNLMGYDGNFLWDKDQRVNSYLCYYDTVSGDTGVACKDGGYGPLYYLNGKFVTEYYDVNDAYSQQYIMAYYPDGSGAEYLKDMGFNNILDISEDGEYLAWNDFNTGRTQISEGNTYDQDYAVISYEDMLIDAEFCYGKLVMLNQNSESGYITFEVIDPNAGEKTNLGGFKPKGDQEGYVRLQNTIWEEGDIYVGLAWVDMHEVVTNFTVVKLDTVNANPPEIVYNEYPEVCENGGYPYFGLNYDNEVLVKTVKEGDVLLSNHSFGDLNWYDSFYSANLVAKDYLKENPFEAKKGDTVKILQKAEVCGENAFVITADAKALQDVQSADFDRYADFVWQNYTYSRISLDSVANGGVNFKEEEIKIDNLDGYEAVGVRQIGKQEEIPAEGPFAADTAEKAFDLVIETYQKAIDEGWDREKAAAEGLADSVYDSVWPSGFQKGGNGGYTYLDVDKNGQDELVIVYDGSLLAIYGFNGKEAVMSFNKAYRHEAYLYEDGMIQVLFGTMNSAAEYWYRYNTESGQILPVAEKTYTPDKDQEKDVQCFIYGAEVSPEEVIENYKEWGIFPVWAWEWADELTEEEFESCKSKMKVVKFPKATPFN